MKKLVQAVVLGVVVSVVSVGAPSRFSWAVGSSVAAAGGSSYPVTGTNVPRGIDQLVVYSRTATQVVSPANRWGAEAVVQSSTVLAIRDRQSTGQAATPIPVGETVLSGHGAARVWMLSFLHVGGAVTYPGSGTAPGPGAAPWALVDGVSHVLAGVDIPRDTDALVAYTGAAGASTPTNQWGAEVAVLAGQVTQIRDRQSTGAAAMPIPSGGFVLSGHGASRVWLLAHAVVGASASYGLIGQQQQPPPGPCSAGYVRLTFDDGPDAVVTPQVLDTLKARGVKATFFVIGSKVADQAALVRREITDGHQVGNHTWDHPYLTQLTASEQTAELQMASAAIVAAGAPQPTLWRPPYEDWNSSVQALASSLGMTMVLWTYETDSNDWQGGTPEVIRDRIVTNAHDGDTVLMHDRIQNSATALPMILDGLAAKNMCVR